MDSACTWNNYKKEKFILTPFNISLDARRKMGVVILFERIYKQLHGTSLKIDLTEFYHRSIEIERHSDGTYTSKFINDEFYANIFCLYAIYSQSNLRDQQIKISRQMMGFGSHVLLILEPKKFVEQVKKAIAPKVDNFHCSLVKYRNMKELAGIKNYFDKPLHLSYQNEFRVAFQHNREEALVMDIGIIEDQSILLRSDELMGIEFGKL